MRWALAVVWCLWTASLCAQSPASDTLDVIVEDATSARPLSAADFVVSEAGQPVSIQAARLVQPSASGAPLAAINSADDEAVSAAQANRLVGVFIDEYHLRDDGAWAAARVSLAALLRSSLGPRDLVIVTKPLDSLATLRLTTDRESAARIVEGAAPRQGDYTARSEFERSVFAGAPARQDAARNQIALSAIGALTGHLGQFPASRKTLIVVSNGLVGPSMPGRDVALPSAIVRSANLTHVAIYAFRPTPLAPAGPDDAASDAGPSDALVRMAEQTTGLVVSGGADMESGVRRALRDASRYYELSLDAASPADGRLRPVTVALRSSTAPVRARAGIGHLARVASGDPGPSRPVTFNVPRHRSTLIRTWFGQSAAENGATSVTFVWEPAPTVPGGRGIVATPARVAMSVTLQDGTPVFDGTTGPSGRGALLAASAQPQLVFTTPPVTLLVQMDVLDPAGRVLDHDVRDVTVASFDRPLGFGTAAIFRGRSQREVSAIVNERASVAPVAAREFSRAEQLVVRVPLVAHGGNPEVTAQLQSRFGSPVRDLRPTMLEGPGHRVQVELPLAPLASGGYSLVFTARSGLGTVVESVDFGVTP